MAGTAQNALDVLAQKGFAQTTDLNHEFSYGQGIKNVTGMKNTNLTMNIRIRNTTSRPQRVGLSAIILKGIAFNDGDSQRNEKAFDFIPMFVPETIPDKNEPYEVVEIESMDSDQNLAQIATELAYTPAFISGLNMRSYNLASGSLESTNFSNTLTHEHKSPWKKDAPVSKIDLAKFQTGTDFHLSLMEMDFIKNKFPAFISANDAIVLTVNQGTELNIIVTIGARDSRSEYFYRQITNGVDMLNQYTK